MFKRLRWTTTGYVLGVATSYVVAVRVRRAVRRFTADDVRLRLGEGLAATRDAVAAALADGRAAMAAREAELRAARGLDRQRDRPAPRS